MIYGMFIHALECDEVKNAQRWFVGIIYVFTFYHSLVFKLKQPLELEKKIIKNFNAKSIENSCNTRAAPGISLFC